MARRLRVTVLLLAILFVGFIGGAHAQGFEVWVLDQGMNRLDILGDRALSSQKPQESIDLAPHGGVKPHMIYFSPAYDYAFIANVGTLVRPTTPDPFDEPPATTSDGVPYYAAVRVRLDASDEYAAHEPADVALFDPLAKGQPERKLRAPQRGLCAAGFAG